MPTRALTTMSVKMRSRPAHPRPDAHDRPEAPRHRCARAARRTSLLLPLRTGVTETAAPALNGIHKIQHVVIIMQENRSFDSYFGTFPGADGIPMQNGVPTVCVPDPKSGTCVKPYHDPKDRNAGGPHAAKNATADIDGGKMDGFVREAHAARRHCANPDLPACTNDGGTDVMGYHGTLDIPKYWT